MVKLEVFDTPDTAERMAYLDPASVETLRNAAYEQGYTAGWQDAADAARTSESERMVALTDAFQALSFTYAEARSMADAQFADIVAQFVAQIVPALCAASLPGRVAQEVRLMLARDASAPLQVLYAPGTGHTLEDIMAKLPQGARITLLEEPTLAPSQVLLRGQDQTREIDFAALLALAQAAISPGAAGDFDHHKGAAHG